MVMVGCNLVSVGEAAFSSCSSFVASQILVLDEKAVAAPKILYRMVGK